MLPVTQDFLDAVASGGRIVGKVVVDYTDPFLDQSIEVTASEQARTSYPRQTADSVESVPYKWASLDGSWVLDGTWHLMPGPEDADRYQVGWWGKQLAGAGGAFSAPYPTLVVTHSPRPIHSLRVVGDDKRQEYPVDFTIRLYSESNVLLHTETVTGNTEIRWEKTLTVPVLDVARQELEITRWSHEGRQVKIVEFFTSVQQTYESSDLVEISLLEERDVSAGGLPVGSISSNEISVRIRNDDRRFDVDNSQSPLYRLLKPNRRIRAWLGTLAENHDTENPPVFTRPSVAYLSDGTQVASGQPRFESVSGRTGLRVEEGTTNLYSAAASRGESWSGWSGSTVIITTGQPDPFGGTRAVRVQASGGTSVLKAFVTAGVPANGVTWAGQIWVRNRIATPLTLHSNLGAQTRTVQQSEGWVWVPWVVTGNGVGIAQHLLQAPTAADIVDCDVCFLQYEEKPYQTSWQEGGTTRAAESFYATLPQPLPQEFTAMGWFVPDQSSSVLPAFAEIVRFQNASVTTPLTGIYVQGGTIRFAWNNVFAANSGVTFAPGDQIGWAVTKFGSQFKFYVKKGMNPTVIVSGTHSSVLSDLDRVYVGGSTQTRKANGLHDDIVVLSRALSDAEVEAYFTRGREWELDEDTLLYLSFNGSIYPVEQVWVPLGVFWSTEWQAPEDRVHATVVARDRLELLRKSTFASSYVRQGWDLCDLATEVLKDAGLVEGADFFVCPSLHGIVVPYAWLEPVSHREALRLIAEAALGTVYCDRSGRIVVHTIYDLGREPVLEIGPSQYFRADAPMRPGEVANEVIVWTSPLQPASTPEEVYRSNEPITVEAGQVARLTAYYNERPVIDAQAVLVGATATLIQDAQYYGWGAEITLYNPSATDESVTVVIEGKPLQVRNREIAIARDEQSIREHGVLRYEVADNPLIQTRQVAQRLADLILASAKDPRRDLTLEWRGNPAVELGDRITVKGLDYHVISNELTWTGGLRARTVGRRAV